MYHSKLVFRSPDLTISVTENVLDYHRRPSSEGFHGMPCLTGHRLNKDTRSLCLKKAAHSYKRDIALRVKFVWDPSSAQKNSEVMMDGL
ncbi:hypothetical protein D5086_003431 [Populus alba]|uniref:Uncharacterized protein n=1 Tax=Populus alba TaxID=43335 RepID=A0ACC4D6K5_POPAL